MPKIETLKTKSLNEKVGIQVNKVSFIKFKSGAVAEVYEVSCFEKGKKQSRFALERFLMPERALAVFEQRVASEDATVLSGNPNAIKSEMIAYVL